MSETLNLSDLSQTDLQQLDVVERYTQFAPVYNQSVDDWGYQCYRTAADALEHYLPTNAPILDAGCGTGLVGQVLAQHGYRDVTGIDISQDMLEQAEATGHYQQVKAQDLSQTPYPFADNHFAAIACVGVFSLIADPAPVLREFCRLVRSQGYLVFTQQEVLFEQYGYAEVLRGFEERGELRCESVSEPVVYLPKREGYADRKVIYCIYQVLKQEDEINP
ncbi:MAG: Methyltransferase type 11 domain protein (Fragment) [uncultured Thiotrichaceae bacterium]|uniref:Methyltransferase type 11 domain protein n=1 Tax=uncultured Thiotrichaceae bacterium TaxID=298394 RepID=A0A6S6SHC8_9GAMM